MNCKFFGIARPKRNTNIKTARGKNKHHNGQSIIDVMTKIKFNDVEEYVCKHFQKLLVGTSYKDYHYFLMHDSWKKLFIENSEYVFNIQQHMVAYETIIASFPELEADVYEYLLNGCIEDSFDCELRAEISISEHILLPMALHERNFGSHFSYIREEYKEILEATITFADFYAVAAILNNEFDIPEEALQDIVSETISETIDAWLSKELCYEHFESLIGFFRSREAYEAFMENIYELFAVHGLSLYCFLVKAVGPRREILDNEYFCYEFMNQ